MLFFLHPKFIRKKYCSLFSKVEQLRGKQAVMKLLTAEDPNVRYHALLAVQKLMVHNWEYLGRQLDADAGITAS